MEDFAAQIAASGTAESITQVYDQYLNFVVGEPDLFSLALGKETYWALNSAQTEDDVLDSMVDRIVTGLYSVVVTMGEYRRTCSFMDSPVPRVDSHHSCSKVWRSRDDCNQARPKASRPHSQLQRQPLLEPDHKDGHGSWLAVDFKTGSDHS